MMKSKLTILLISALLVNAASTADAVQPRLSAIQPYGFQRGTDVDVEFKGARLGDTKELMLYSPGITVAQLEASADNTVKAKLQVAADCRLGLHAVRIRTASGISNLHLFSIGNLPEVAEVEPNSEFGAPQPVALGCTISGIVQTEDVDYFVVEAKKGQRICAELEGLRLGNTFFDPYLAILNTERFELSRSDDAALLNQDCLCAIIAPEDGKYIIQVRESAYGGDGNCKYRLHLGSFPRPTAVLPAGGKPGETVSVHWIGDPAGAWDSDVTIPADNSPYSGVIAADEHGVAPSPNRVRVADLANVLEVEPNNTNAEATAFTAPAALNGVIQEMGDTDSFKFAATKGQVFDINVYAREPLRSPLDSVLTVSRLAGGQVGNNDDNGGPDSYYRFTAPEDGEFVVNVRDHLQAGGPSYVYRIEVAPVTPQITMTLPERTQYVATTLEVPQGNRMALMVNATRNDFGGDLQVAFDGLPAGMTAESHTMAANQSSIPVLFTAAADAPVAGSLVDVIGKPTDPASTIVGHLAQRTMLVRGRNNRDVWGHDADRMAAATTDPIPFKIEIVQPQAPVVRRGSMQLKVVATRQEGFSAPIASSMLYNPPGIASSGSISIPEGATEATIPVTANGGAAIGTWKIVVIGRASHGGGNVEAATQLADLVIADSFYNFNFNKTAAEIGQDIEMLVNVEKKQDFEGAAKIELLGLPAGTSTEPAEFTKDTTEVVFKIKIDESARPGTYKTLVCRAVSTVNGEPVTYTQGSGELRVDKPLPPKVAAAPKPEPQPAAVAAAPAKPKPLSRLEQLRLQRKQESEQE